MAELKQSMLASRIVHSRFLWLAVIMVTCVSMIRVFAGSPENIPPPKGKYSEDTVCVEPVEIMRRRHFEYILDHRDKTVIEGIRTKQYSLIGCIDCHITPNERGEYARYSEETHFCASCHQFTAVTIDCFQCHADRPEEAVRTTLDLSGTTAWFLREVHERLQLDALVQ